MSSKHAAAVVDTCTWTGATNANWSNGGNWTGCDNSNVPENGDTLIFPESASNKTTNNDISSLTLNHIEVTGSGYTLGGNDFTITDSGALQVSQSATIDNNVTYTGSNVFLFSDTGTTLTVNGTSNFALPSGEVNVGGTGWDGTVDFVGNVTGAAQSQFIAVNGATAIVRGASNTFTATDVGAESNAKFECRSATCFGNNANHIYAGGGIVHLRTAATYSNDIETSGSTSNVSAIYTYENVTLSGNTTVNDQLFYGSFTSGKTLTVNGNVNLASANLEVSGIDRTGVTIFNGVISGSYGVITFASTTVLAGNNTYTGITTATSGAATISVTNVNGLGASGNGTYIGNGDMLNIDIAGPGSFSIPEPITVEGTGEGDAGAILNSAASAVDLAGQVTLTGDTKVSNPIVNSAIVFMNTISGTGDLTLVGKWNSSTPGVLTVAGSGTNSYSGDTIVGGGVVYFQKVDAIPHNLTINTTDPSTNQSAVHFLLAGVMNDAGVLTMGGDQNTLMLGANNEVIGGLTGTGGTVELTNDGDKLIIDQDSDTTFSGEFYSAGNSSTYEKRGSGTLTLNGDYQALPDNISFLVSEGTLVVNGNIRTTTGGDLTVAGGVLKGVGTVGDVTLTSGSIAPGHSPGTLHVASLTLNSGSTFQQDIAGSTAGTQYDQLIASGTVTLGGAALSLVPSYTPADGTVFTIITASSVSGTFNGLPDGATVTANGLKFRINYSATSVTLTSLGGTLSSPSAPNTGFNHRSTTKDIIFSVMGVTMLTSVIAFRRKLYAFMVR